MCICTSRVPRLISWFTWTVYEGSLQRPEIPQPTSSVEPPSRSPVWIDTILTLASSDQARLSSFLVARQACPSRMFVPHGGCNLLPAQKLASGPSKAPRSLPSSPRSPPCWTSSGPTFDCRVQVDPRGTVINPLPAQSEQNDHPTFLPRDICPLQSSRPSCISYSRSDPGEVVASVSQVSLHSVSSFASFPLPFYPAIDPSPSSLREVFLST